MKIAIDIGHAHGTGASGNGAQEHAVCSKLAVALKAALESFKVDRFEVDIIDFPALSNGADLAAAAKAVNAGKYAACVSLHMDWSDNPDDHGAHVCYCSAAGKRLADEIALRLCPQMPGRAEKTVKRSGLYILRKTRPLAVLVECGFITNEGDTRWVIEHPDKVAMAIALGVSAGLNLNMNL